MASSSKPDPRRYGTSTVRVRDLKVCFYCDSSPLPGEAFFCPSCGFPQRGTEPEQRRFILNKKQMDKNVKETEASIGIARIVLFGLGLLNGGIGAWWLSNEDRIGGITQLVVAAIYVALGLWAGKKPFPALLTGLILYLTFVLLTAIINPLTLFSAIIIKIAIVSSLIYGMRAVKIAENMRNRMKVQKMDLSATSENSSENG